MQVTPSSIMSFHNPETRLVLDIGWDLDGVVANFDHAYFEAMVALRPDHPCWKTWGRSFNQLVTGRAEYKPAQTWNFFEELYGQTRPEFTEVCNEAVDKGLIFTRDRAIPGALSAWNDLRAAGHRIHVKTARSFGSHPIASEVATLGWLHREQFAYESILFTHDKTAGTHIDMMLEDNLDNYDALDAAGVEVWLIDRAWNQDDGTRRRVYSHDEFVTRVNAFANRAVVQQRAAEEQRKQEQTAETFRALKQAAEQCAVDQLIALSDTESDLVDV